MISWLQKKIDATRLRTNMRDPQFYLRFTHAEDLDLLTDYLRMHTGAYENRALVRLAYLMISNATTREFIENAPESFMRDLHVALSGAPHMLLAFHCYVYCIQHGESPASMKPLRRQVPLLGDPVASGEAKAAARALVHNSDYTPKQIAHWYLNKLPQGGMPMGWTLLSHGLPDPTPVVAIDWDEVSFFLPHTGKEIYDKFAPRPFAARPTFFLRVKDSDTMQLGPVKRPHRVETMVDDIEQKVGWDTDVHPLNVMSYLRVDYKLMSPLMDDDCYEPERIYSMRFIDELIWKMDDLGLETGHLRQDHATFDAFD